MYSWFAEQGIGETRLACFHRERLVAARLDWHEPLQFGARVAAQIVAKQPGSRGVARMADGTEILLNRVDPWLSEGRSTTVAITRAPSRESGRAKPAQGIPTDSKPRTWSALEALRDDGVEVTETVRFPFPGWDEVMQEAFAGEVAFSGGSLLLWPTPAMLLVDIDGTLPPRDLALAAVAPLAATLHRLDIGGNVGIDFPTLPERDGRKAVDAALDGALSDYLHERTAMNGFGFVQLVARKHRPSLLERARFQPREAAARLLLRRAERLEGTGRAIELAAQPLVLDCLTPDWLDELRRRTGRDVLLRPDPGIAFAAPHAQLVAL